MTSSPSNQVRIEPALFERSASDALALVDGNRRWSWRDFVSVVLELASRLEEAGVRRGERVAFFLDKSAESACAFYATWAVGAIAVPIHPSLRNAQVAHILRDSGAGLLVTSARKRATLSIELPPVLLVDDQTQPVARFEPMPGVGADLPAAILYTSGSTGKPKGILLSHANLVAGARITSRYLEITPADRLLGLLPFSFDYGLNQLLSATATGAALVLQRSPLPADICRTLDSEQVTLMAAVPPLWIQLLGRHSPFQQLELPALRAITNTGGVFPTELSRALRERRPELKIFLMYGLSEAFRSSFLAPNLVDEKPGSIGQAIPESTLFVLDEHGCECGEDEVGELVHAGPTVALGYWNNPEATSAVFREHPFDREQRAVWSGDLVRRDADGDLYFVGRNDQLIKTLGFRVSPEEVEEVLRECELVSQVAVEGVPDAELGASILAHIVPADPSSFSTSALLEFCRTHMPRHLIPKHIRVHGELPLTGSGKLDRRGLAS